MRINDRVIAGWLLAATIACGYAFPKLTVLFAPFSLTALFVMIMASLLPMARLQLGEIFSLESDTLRVVFWQLFVLPCIILAAAHLARLSESIVTLMALTACAGSLFASPALADLLGLNQRKALQCMVLSTFLMPFSYFFFLKLILHASVDIEIADFVGRSGMFLMLPASLFLFYSAYVDDIPAGVVDRIETGARFVTIGALMVFGLGIIGPAANLLWTDPARFTLLLVAVTGLGAGMAAMTTVVMYRHGINNALTASIVSGFRNVGLGYVLIQHSATPDALAYVGISQIQIFIAPLIMRLFVADEATAARPDAEDAGRGASAGRSMASPAPAA